MTKMITPNQQNLTRLNVEKLRGVISYFSYLHKNGEISDTAFENLVNYACSIFIENEIKIKIQNTLERKIQRFMRSKLSISQDEIDEIETAISSLELSRIIRNK